MFLTDTDSHSPALTHRHTTTPHTDIIYAQVLVSNLTGLAWNSYFSFISHRDMVKGKGGDKEDGDTATGQ